jgi:hypothetical protein
MTAHHRRAEAIQRGARMLRTALGPAIARLLEDPAIVEVMLNPDGRICNALDRRSGSMCSSTFFAITPFLAATGVRADSSVPQNHRLVIQHVSGSIAVSSNPGSILVVLSQFVAGITPSSTFIVTSLFPFDSVSRVGVFLFDQPVLLYFDAGQTPAVQVSVGLSSSVINYNVDITLTGYLLDCTAAPCQPIAH